MESSQSRSGGDGTSAAGAEQVVTRPTYPDPTGGGSSGGGESCLNATLLLINQADTQPTGTSKQPVASIRDRTGCFWSSDGSRLDWYVLLGPYILCIISLQPRHSGLQDEQGREQTVALSEVTAGLPSLQTSRFKARQTVGIVAHKEW